MIDAHDLEDRLRRTFDAVAATTRVEVAPRAPRARRRTTSSIVAVGSLLVAAVVVTCTLLVARDGDGRSRVRTHAPIASPTSVGGLRSIRGKQVVANEQGQPVGYLDQSLIAMPPKEFDKRVNARTMWPVTDAHGAIVGYLAPDVPFLPLAVVNAPGFDIEKVRAARFGGCENRIGDPTFKQEFPLCRNGSSGR